MIKKLFSISLLTLALTGCEDNRNYTVTTPDKDAEARDRTLTPFDQSEKEADRNATQIIRRTIIEEKNLSNNAKNIKIITIDGKVTLRGVVNSEEEKKAIENIVRNIANIANVDNQLEVRK